ncbi:MAG: PilZ domain-containing protein [Nitrospiraceae bacterium]|nr:PilZ domain-containing protein [Nitrospiraceae bacterium]
MAKQYKARSHSRVPVSCFLYYLGDGLVGTGKVCDLSVKGWRIEGDKPVTIGMKLTLRVFLPDQPKAIDIDGAMVQWVKDRVFGLEIVRMSASAETRIHKFVESMLNPPGSSRVA